MQATTFLMFTGMAEEAVHFYVSVLKNSRIVAIERYAAQPGESVGKVMRGEAVLAGTKYIFTDSPIRHEFSFTPAISIFLDVDSSEELDELASKLGQDGKTLMPTANYGFSQRFTWLEDRFGVSWQINLP